MLARIGPGTAWLFTPLHARADLALSPQRYVIYDLEKKVVLFQKERIAQAAALCPDTRRWAFLLSEIEGGKHKSYVHIESRRGLHEP